MRCAASEPPTLDELIEAALKTQRRLSQARQRRIVHEQTTGLPRPDLARREMLGAAWARIGQAQALKPIGRLLTTVLMP